MSHFTGLNSNRPSKQCYTPHPPPTWAILWPRSANKVVLSTSANCCLCLITARSSSPCPVQREVRCGNRPRCALSNPTTSANAILCFCIYVLKMINIVIIEENYGKYMIVCIERMPYCFRPIIKLFFNIYNITQEPKKRNAALTPLSKVSYSLFPNYLETPKWGFKPQILDVSRGPV